MLRALGRRRMFFRDGEALARLADIDTVVFDKTGTLTACGGRGEEALRLDGDEKEMVHALALNSSHPASRHLADRLKPGGQGLGTASPVDHFKEIPGEGVEGLVLGRRIRIGRAGFAGRNESNGSSDGFTHIRIDGESKGSFRLPNAFRPGLAGLVRSLKAKGYRLAVLTGDGEKDRGRLEELFGPGADLRFNQSPAGKLAYIKELQASGRRVLMAGDGLNDAGALLQSDAGISVSDGANNFTPASDGIVEAGRFAGLDKVLAYARAGRRIIYAGFGLSLLYNIAGLSFAVQGTLSPVVAAVLMPASTVSLVLLAVGAAAWAGKRYMKDDLSQPSR
jgi:Cu+-exporting ATPase